MGGTRSLIERSPHVEPGLLAFAAAARSIELGNLRMAIGLLAAIDDAPLRAHFDAAGAEWRRRHSEASTPYPEGIDKALRDPARMPTKTIQLRTFERDRWHCRWCGSPVLALSAVRHMHAVVGAAFPHGGKNVNHHGLTLAAGASLDHVVPHALGGTNGEDNLVTACWPCQFARGDDSIDRLGIVNPLDYAPAVALPGWDGCSWFTSKQRT